MGSVFLPVLLRWLLTVSPGVPGSDGVQPGRPPPPPHLDTVWKEPLWIPAIGFHLGSCSALKACGREVTQRFVGTPHCLARLGPTRQVAQVDAHARHGVLIAQDIDL